MSSSSPIMLLRAARLAGLIGSTLILSGCGSINIPLGSLLGSNKTEVASADPSLTAPPAPVASVSSTALSAPTTAESTPESIKTAAKLSPDKPFSLEADSSDVTGSLGDAASPGFNADDHAAVLSVLSEALPETGPAVSTSWTNSATGSTGMVVPMASLSKGEDKNCRDLLISYGKDSRKQWYRSEGCRKAGKWQLGAVSPWRKTR